MKQQPWQDEPPCDYCHKPAPDGQAVTGLPLPILYADYHSDEFIESEEAWLMLDDAWLCPACVKTLQRRYPKKLGKPT
jgi:hypothetical protein